MRSRPAALFTGTGLLTLSYDSDALPSGMGEDQLYVATHRDGAWQPVIGGVIDPQRHTVSVSLAHFSLYSLFAGLSEAAYDVVETFVGDEVSRGSLPEKIQTHLYEELGFQPHHVQTVTAAKLSLATRGASSVISLANLVSQTAGHVLSAMEGTQELLIGVGQSLLAAGTDQATDSQAGSLLLTCYDSFQLGQEIGKVVYAVKGTASLSTVGAQAAAWLLSQEMEYINANMDQAFDGLWKLNPGSLERLEIRAVYLRAEPLDEEQGLGARGIKFYYKRSDGQWINYHDDMVYWQMTFQPDEGASEPRRKPSPTPTNTRMATPTATDTPSPTDTPTAAPSSSNGSSGLFPLKILDPEVAEGDVPSGDPVEEVDVGSTFASDEWGIVIPSSYERVDIAVYQPGNSKEYRGCGGWSADLSVNGQDVWAWDRYHSELGGMYTFYDASGNARGTIVDTQMGDHFVEITDFVHSGENLEALSHGNEGHLALHMRVW